MADSRVFLDIFRERLRRGVWAGVALGLVLLTAFVAMAGWEVLSGAYNGWLIAGVFVVMGVVVALGNGLQVRRAPAIMAFVEAFGPRLIDARYALGNLTLLFDNGMIFQRRSGKISWCRLFGFYGADGAPLPPLYDRAFQEVQGVMRASVVSSKTLPVPGEGAAEAGNGSSPGMGQGPLRLIVLERRPGSVSPESPVARYVVLDMPQRGWATLGGPLASNLGRFAAQFAQLNASVPYPSPHHDRWALPGGA